jgi:hypothetical protein
VIVTFYATPQYLGKKVGEPIRIDVDTEEVSGDEAVLRDAAYDYAHQDYGGRFTFEIEEVSRQS